MKKNLVLLGMPGSGKSVIGHSLARETGLKLYDIDKLIEKELGLTISNIFEKNGMVIGVAVYSEATKANIDQKHHDHYVQKGNIDFSVIIAPDLKEIKNEQTSARIIMVNHNDLPELHLNLKKLLTLK